MVNNMVADSNPSSVRDRYSGDESAQFLNGSEAVIVRNLKFSINDCAIIHVIHPPVFVKIFPSLFNISICILLMLAVIDVAIKADPYRFGVLGSVRRRGLIENVSLTTAENPVFPSSFIYRLIYLYLYLLFGVSFKSCLRR